VTNLFGLSRDALLVGVTVGMAIVGLGLVGVAVTRPLLMRMALRNLPRRPGFAALITLGLTLGTIILSTAFTTGDTMSLSVRTVVAGALGTADEVVLVPGATQPTGFDFVQSIAGGNLLTGATMFFPVSDVDRVQHVVGDDPHVAAIVGAILAPVAVENGAGDAFRAQVNLVAVPVDAPSAIGALESADRQPLSLAELAPNEVYLNSEAASALGVGADDTVQLIGLDPPVSLRVRAITGLGKLGGGQAALFMPLARAQALLGQPAAINEVLIANRGSDAERLDASWPLTVKLRSAFANQGTVQRAFRALTQPAARTVVQSAASRLSSPAGDKLRLLSGALDATTPSPQFAALVQDPEVILGITATVPGGLWRADARGPLNALSAPGSLRVLDVQRLAQNQADLWGSAFTDLFVVAGSFSLASGVLLIVLVFSLVALERRTELGVVRAIGGRRSDVIALMAIEGALYSLLSAVFGLGGGVLLALGIVDLASSLVEQYGFELEPSVQLSSLALSFGLGTLLTFVTVTLTAWRSSRFSIVSAIRDLPEPSGGSTAFRSLAPMLVTLGAGIGLLELGLRRSASLPYAAGVVLAVVGVALFVRWLLVRFGWRAPERVVFTGAGLVLIGWWAVPWSWLARLHLPVVPRTPDMTFLAGLGLLLGAVWVIAYNVGLLRLVQRGGGVVWRLSVAYTAAQRFRTGLTLAMFGLVVLSLTLAAVLLTATTRAFGDPVAATGGWDIRAESTAPPTDIRPALEQGGLSPDAFSAIGGMGPISVQALQLDSGVSASWQSATVDEVDDGVLSLQVAGTQLTGSIANQADTWQLLQSRPGTAIVGARLLRGVAPSLRVISQEGSGFRPTVLWVRDTRSTRPVVKLDVVGIVDGRGPFGNAILVGPGTLAGWPPPDRSSYFFAVPGGADARNLAEAINLAQPSLQAQPIGEQLRLIQGVRGLLTLILQGFMGVGILAGIAALGTISLRTVVERRRQIGVLRSLGVGARGIGLGLLSEAALVASLGCLIGFAVGLAVAYETVDLLTARNPELRFSVPWDQLALIAAPALLATLAITAIPAARAGRLSPAAALREE
jgi:putative ABC transport system permease protein